MITSQASKDFIASAFASAAIALALASSAHAADYPAVANPGSASGACERAKQFAIFKRQMERTDGDVSPALPGTMPPECRVTQAAKDRGAMRSAANDSKEDVPSNPKK